MLFVFLAGDIVQQHGDENNHADYHEDSQHTEPHIRKIINKCPGVESHIRVPPLHEEVQDQAARDNGSDLTGNVHTSGLHQQEVLRIFLETHFVNYSARHREG